MSQSPPTPQPGDSSPPRKGRVVKPWHVLGVFLAIIAVFAAIEGLPDWSSPERDATSFCEREVAPRLKAPSTAEFVDDVIVSALDGGRYVVRGSVDAQNTFGARIRTRYRCTAEVDGETWSLVRITFDD